MRTCARVRASIHSAQTCTDRRLGTYKCACTCVIFSACRRAPGAAARANANGSETADAHAVARLTRGQAGQCGHRRKRRCACKRAICARPKHPRPLKTPRRCAEKCKCACKHAICALARTSKEAQMRTRRRDLRVHADIEENANAHGVHHIPNIRDIIYVPYSLCFIITSIEYVA